MPTSNTETENRYSVAWSLDENHIYLDDNTFDDRLVDVHFTIGGSNQLKERKIKILQLLVEALTERTK